MFSPEPTKLDQDVLLAVNAATLDEHRHKLVKKWQDLVLSCPQEVRRRSDHHFVDISNENISYYCVLVGQHQERRIAYQN